MALLDKNAYLAIYLNDESISSVLTYSHYDVERHYTLSDYTKISKETAPMILGNFWSSYFESLEVKFDWKLFEQHYGAGLMPVSYHRIAPFVDEGVGIRGIKIAISSHTENYQEVIRVIRDHCPQIAIEIVDTKKTEDISVALAEKLDYQDLLLVEANVKDIKISRVTKNLTYKASLKNLQKSEWGRSSAKVRWDRDETLIEALFNHKLEAFLTVDSKNPENINNWANFVVKKATNTPTDAVKDILRSLTTVQFYSIYNDNKKLFENFGTSPSVESAVIVTGSILGHIDNRAFILALLDGFQLRGRFDLIYDNLNTSISLGKLYSLGVNSPETILTKSHMKYELNRIYVPEIPGSETESKIVFDGAITTEVAGVVPIYTLSQHIYMVNLPFERAVFEGSFIKGSYVEGLANPISLLNNEKGVLYKSVVIDSRYKPVVYGPDYKKNRQMIEKWLS